MTLNLKKKTSQFKTVQTRKNIRNISGSAVQVLFTSMIIAA